MNQRILLKLSGEMLGNDEGSGISSHSLQKMAYDIQSAYQVQQAHIGVVIGAGNIMRGTSTDFLPRVKADSAGMLGTSINAIALQGYLEEKFQIPSIVLGSFGIEGIFAKASPQLIEESFAQNKIIIFAGGTGSPYFSTDTAGVLKALEMKATLMVKATKVDGVYDKDPKKFTDAQRFNSLTYQEILNKQLKVMDLTAVSLAMENHLPIRVTELNSKNLVNIIQGYNTGTLVHEN